LASADRSHDAADEDEGEQRPCLRQRFSPFADVLTTVHPQGLVIRIRRAWRQRTFAVGFERLVLEPTTIVSLRAGLLWTAAGLCAAGLLTALADSATVAPLATALSSAGHAALAALAPALLVAAVLVLLAAVTHPRRVTLFLDREAGMHPSFLRGGPRDPEAAAFVALVQRAIVEYRCRPPDTGDGERPAAPRLASTLDALVAMQRDELLTAPEFARFRELALRR
jgi:hypothetical protein